MGTPERGSVGFERLDHGDPRPGRLWTFRDQGAVWGRGTSSPMGATSEGRQPLLACARLALSYENCVDWESSRSQASPVNPQEKKAREKKYEKMSK